MNKICLILWVIGALVLCLMPGKFFKSKSTLESVNAAQNHSGTAEKNVSQKGVMKHAEKSVWFRGRIQHEWKEWVAHAGLMMGIAFCLIPYFRSCGKLRSLLFTLLSIYVIAVLIEMFQYLLPFSFHRGFSMSDVWASLFGGVVGALGSILFLSVRSYLDQRIPLCMQDIKRDGA